MVRPRVVTAGLVAFLLLVWGPSAWAQQTLSGLAGVIKDAAGMPVAGATVEAASPALIERVRSVVTDSSGQYKINDLQPGVYAVTVRAPGFGTLTKTGIELAAAFVATVNADLKLGNPAEVVTVTATVTQVDTRTTQQNLAVTDQAKQRDATTAVTSTTGVNVSAGSTDVGGSSGAYASTGNSLTTRGKSGVIRLFDGLRIENGNGATSYMTNSAVVAQTVVETGGGIAESLAAGGTINSVPKSGSNALRGGFSGLFTRESFQGDNLSDNLRARGLTAVNKVGRISDFSVTVGGPIKQDKLWYFFAPRIWGNRNYAAGVFYNATQHSGLYTQDLSRRADQFEDYQNQPLRLVWQTNAKNKFNFLVDFPDKGCSCRSSLPSTTDPAAVSNFVFGNYPSRTLNLVRGYGLLQTTWSYARNSKLLYEAGWSYMIGSYWGQSQPDVAETDIARTDSTLGFTWGSKTLFHSGWNEINHSNRMAERFSVSYITGSHAYKVGISSDHSWQGFYESANQNVNYTFNQGKYVNGVVNCPNCGQTIVDVPSSITEYATPYPLYMRIGANVGIFAQDQWTIRRLTLNYGLRFSYFDGFVPPVSAPPTQFVPFTRTYDQVHCVPCWTDFDPRFGAAYDLFGNGRTAIKASWARFVNNQHITIAQANNPFNTSVNSVTRSWNNPTGNSASVPNCDLTNPLLNGDCGQISNLQFGLSNPNATRYDPSVINGHGVRDYYWDGSLTLSHQLTRTVSLTGGYYYNALHNINVTQNIDAVPSTYSPYCVTTPVNAGLPGGGGQQLCGFYDVSQQLFGHVHNVVTQSSNFGDQKYVNHFLGFQTSARLARGIRVSGGVDSGTTTSDNCYQVNSPQDKTYNTTYNAAIGAGTISTSNPTYCHAVIGWVANLTLKANGTVPLPYGFSVSPTWQNNAGAMDLAIWNAPATAIAPTLGRAPSACGAKAAEACGSTIAIPLIQPGTQYEDRRNQLDVRLSKSLQLTKKVRSQLNLDVFNLTNNAAVVSLNNTFNSTAGSTTWLRPTKVLDARFFQLSGRIDF